MPLNSLTVTINKKRLIDGFVQAAINNNTTPEAIAVEFLENAGKNYADLFNIGVFPSAAFMARFTPEEYTNIMIAAMSNEQVAFLVRELTSSPIVNVDDPRVEPGLQQLVSAGLLGANRVVEIMNYDRPEVTINSNSGG